MPLSRRDALTGGAALAAAAGVSPRALAGPRGFKLSPLFDRVAAEALSAHACPGIQLAIARRGAVLYSRGYGAANLETGTPATERNVFRIGSLTKQFTAACIIRLAADGKLKLDAPVARYLPFMGKLKPISLLELLHHTAGLHDEETEVVQSGRAERTEIAGRAGRGDCGAAQGLRFRTRYGVAL